MLRRRSPPPPRSSASRRAPPKWRPTSPATDPSHPSYGRPPRWQWVANERYRDLHPVDEVSVSGGGTTAMTATATITPLPQWDTVYSLSTAEDGTATLKQQNTVITTLTRQQLQMYTVNPHCRQAFTNPGSLITAEQLPTRIIPHSIIASPDYTSTTTTPFPIATTLVHWPQRQWLLAMIEFLTLHGDKATKVLCCGKVLGVVHPFPRVLTLLSPFFTGPNATAHVQVLAGRFFPQHSFIQVGGSQPASDIANIRYQSGHVTDEFLASFTTTAAPDEKFLFICDLPSSTTADGHVTSTLLAEMQCQQRWLLMLRPVASLLYLDPPASTETASFEYLDGDFYLPVWSHPQKSDIFLIVTDFVSEHYRRDD